MDGEAGRSGFRSCRGSAQADRRLLRTGRLGRAIRAERHIDPYGVLTGAGDLPILRPLDDAGRSVLMQRRSTGNVEILTPGHFPVLELRYYRFVVSAGDLEQRQAVLVRLAVPTGVGGGPFPYSVPEVITDAFQNQALEVDHDHISSRRQRPLANYWRGCGPVTRHCVTT
jgi:hypothetical protein